MAEIERLEGKDDVSNVGVEPFVYMASPVAASGNPLMERLRPLGL